ncbi:MAG: hypothetical protein WCT27_00175 [Patescibacteria group bacterium]
MAKNQKQNVEDIFEETDRAAAKKAVTASGKKRAVRPAVLKSPVVPLSVAREDGAVSGTSGGMFFGNRRFMIAGVALLVVLCAAGAMAAWRSGLFTKETTNTVTTNTNSVQGVNSDAVPVVVNISAVNSALIDTDGDGLADTEEKSLSTDVQKADSDGDGLFDREEVKVYKSDPLKKDTDGDAKDDGVEVQNGYSPVGPGKLYDLTNTLSNTNQ